MSAALPGLVPALPRPDPAAMAVLARLAMAHGALSIGPGKEDFLVARLSPRLAALGIPDFGAYAAHLRDPAGAGEIAPFVESLTTHTTRFFREAVQYDWLRDAGLPALQTRGAGIRRDLVIWSAACSTGQELYSAMMTAAVLGDREDVELRLRGVGTDLSTRVLRTCQRAIYPAEDTADILIDLRRRFLLSAADGSGQVRIVPDLRRRCRWIRANLASAGDMPPITADVALLRNVLIYFDAATRDRVLRNVIGRIGPGGYLLTGHAETIDARRYGLTPVRPSIYEKTAG